jgi:uncharacterized OsmC-like protein
MTEELVINNARSYTFGDSGRCLNTVRNHHFIVDDPEIGEQMTPAEHFLAGVASCAANLIQKTAGQTGVALSRLDVDLTGVRLKSDTSRFQHADMSFTFEGVSQAEADSLVEEYTRRCPLYGALALATTVNISVTVS